MQLFGAGTRITVHPNTANITLLRRKFSVDKVDNPQDSKCKEEVLKKFPYVPLEYTGEEVVLCQTPVEIAVPAKYVIDVIKALNTLDCYNVEHRDKWEIKHIAISYRSVLNNAPTLGSVIRAICHVKVPFVSIVTNGLRMKFLSRAQQKLRKNSKLTREGELFLKWIAEMRQQEILVDKVEIPLIDIGVSYKQCNYPVTWKASSTNTKNDMGFGKGWRRYLYPVFNIATRENGGAEFIIKNTVMNQHSKGLKKIKAYISTAHIVRDYIHDSVIPNLNYHSLKCLKNIRDLNQMLVVLEQAHHRVINALKEKRIYPRLEFSFCYSTFDIESYNPDNGTNADFDAVGHWRYDISARSIYDFIEYFENNEATFMKNFGLRIMAKHECPETNTLARNSRLLLGVLAREGARFWNDSINDHFRNGRMLWLKATTAMTMVSIGFSGQKAHQMYNDWLAGGPDNVIEMSYDPDGWLTLLKQELLWNRNNRYIVKKHPRTGNITRHRMHPKLLDKFGLPTAAGLAHLFMKCPDFFLSFTTRHKIDRFEKISKKVLNNQIISTQQFEFMIDFFSDVNNEFKNKMKQTTIRYRQVTSTNIKNCSPALFNQMLIATAKNHPLLRYLSNHLVPSVLTGREPAPSAICILPAFRGLTNGDPMRAVDRWAKETTGRQFMSRPCINSEIRNTLMRGTKAEEVPSDDEYDIGANINTRSATRNRSGARSNTMMQSSTNSTSPHDTTNENNYSHTRHPQGNNANHDHNKNDDDKNNDHNDHNDEDNDDDSDFNPSHTDKNDQKSDPLSFFENETIQIEFEPGTDDFFLELGRRIAMKKRNLKGDNLDKTLIKTLNNPDSHGCVEWWKQSFKKGLVPFVRRNFALTVDRNTEKSNDRAKLGTILAEAYNINLTHVSAQSDNSGWGPDGRQQRSDFYNNHPATECEQNNYYSSSDDSCDKHNNNGKNNDCNDNTSKNSIEIDGNSDNDESDIDNNDDDHDHDHDDNDDDDEKYYDSNNHPNHITKRHKSHTSEQKVCKRSFETIDSDNETIALPQQKYMMNSNNAEQRSPQKKKIKREHISRQEIIEILSSSSEEDEDSL